MLPSPGRAGSRLPPRPASRHSPRSSPVLPGSPDVTTSAMSGGVGEVNQTDGPPRGRAGRWCTTSGGPATALSARRRSGLPGACPPETPPGALRSPRRAVPANRPRGRRRPPSGSRPPVIRPSANVVPAPRAGSPPRRRASPNAWPGVPIRRDRHPTFTARPALFPGRDARLEARAGGAGPHAASARSTRGRSGPVSRPSTRAHPRGPRARRARHAGRARAPAASRGAPWRAAAGRRGAASRS